MTNGGFSVARPAHDEVATEVECASKRWRKKWLVIRVGGPLILAIGGIAGGCGGDEESATSEVDSTAATASETQPVEPEDSVPAESVAPAETTTTTTEPLETTSTTTTEPAATTTALGSNLTPSQQNALRSAQSYLEFSGFSRQGLIDQLSSEFADQYPVEDATVAVDSLNVDWIAQAVKSAQSYLESSGFSRQGLIDQLSSQFGDQYTLDEATLAVDSLVVDWNAEAAESAQSYLESSGFSCQGLIDQLSSEFGDQYTVEEATFGATQAGIC